MRPFLILIAAVAAVRGQKPEISPGGVVNAASYVAGGQSGRGLSQASLVSIFGSNLASTEQTASGFPLPTTLGGTSVMLNGLRVPILYVSPRQINIQFSIAPLPVPPPSTGPPGLVVVTAAGASEPVFAPGDFDAPFGIFTLDGSGCGRGAVLNIARGGGASLNSPSNSAAPGDFISVYGTGLGAVFNPPPAGSPAGSNPPSLALNWGVYTGIFDLPLPVLRTPPLERVSWAGRAPGFVGLDQVNVRIPDNIREGCGVPLMITTGGRSQPVPISIRRGGGECVDPPAAAYGQITWERTAAGGSITETFTAAFPSSPGRQAPAPLEFREGGGLIRVIDFLGPSCPLPGYRNLEVGSMTIDGPGVGPADAVAAVIEGQQVYRAVLPAGTIQPGSFSVKASGGEVGPFQSSVRIGSGINITSSFPPGTVFRTIGGPPIAVNWTGGDPDAWVILKLVNHLGVSDFYSYTEVPASRGTASINPGSVATGSAEIIVEVVPDPARVPAVSAPGLSLGGQHLWKYTYRFGGLTLL